MTRARRGCRRGAFLAEVMMLVPIIAVTTTIIYQVSIRSMRLESQTMRSLAADARRDDLVRRIREDAATARGATLDRSAEAIVLTLEGCRPASQPADEQAADTQPASEPRGSAPVEPRMVQYRIAGSQVTRTEQPGGQPQAYQWAFSRGGVDFTVEKIADTPRIVWVSFVEGSDRPNPGLRRPLATAVTIGRGGIK